MMHKCERVLRNELPQIATPQRSGLSVDLRLYLRGWDHTLHTMQFLNPDGSLYGEGMVTNDPHGLTWLLGIAVDLGTDLAPARRTG
jgi:hypothetical protein